jgi:hypothetical protein
MLSLEYWADFSRTQICHVQDRVAQLAGQIAIDGVVIYIIPKAHPAVRDELANRAFIVRGLQKLGIALETLKPPPRLVAPPRRRSGG